MGYFKEKLIEQMGHDLNNPFSFLEAQAKRAEKSVRMIAQSSRREFENEEPTQIHVELENHISA